MSRLLKESSLSQLERQCLREFLQVLSNLRPLPGVVLRTVRIFRAPTMTWSSMDESPHALDRVVRFDREGWCILVARFVAHPFRLADSSKRFWIAHGYVGRVLGRAIITRPGQDPERPHTEILLPLMYP